MQQVIENEKKTYTQNESMTKNAWNGILTLTNYY